MNPNSGYIKLHRSILEWEWWDDLNTYRLFTYLLLTANFEDKNWHGITIRRGQVLTSLDTLSKETGLSVGQVRRSLARLISTSEITSETTNQYRIITVCNYDIYQGEQQSNDKQNSKQSDNQTTSERQASDKQTTTTKEYKNDNNIRTKEDSKENTPTSRSKKETTPKFDFKGTLLELGVSELIADEWIRIRRKKRGTNSEFALKTVVDEANKAGISLQEAVEFSAKRQYVGFQASWYINAMNEQRGGSGGGRRGNGHTLEEMARIVDAGIALNDVLGTRNENERNGIKWNSPGK